MNLRGDRSASPQGVIQQPPQLHAHSAATVRCATPGEHDRTDTHPMPFIGAGQSDTGSISALTRLSLDRRLLFELLGLLAGGDGVDEFVELTVEDGGEVVQGETAPMVCHPVLGEVVGPDLL